jgi:SPP1 family predicted phage head-tail adaptor
VTLRGVRQFRGVDVTVELPSQTVVAGNATPNWTVLTTVRAIMQALNAQERQLTGEAEYRFLIAYRSDVTNRCRFGLVGTSRKFPIVGPPIDSIGNQKELIVFAKEKKA